MRGCVLGAGPSGLYVAQKLAEQGIPVSVFEKSGEILGNYKYARVKGTHFHDIPNTRGIELRLNASEAQIDDAECSFYVVATGGRPKAPSILGAELCTPAMEVVQHHYDAKLPFLGDKVCIIGMGNVTLDILNYIKDKCRAVSVLSPRDAEHTPFDNHLLRELAEGGDWSIALQGCDAAAPVGGRGAANNGRASDSSLPSDGEHRSQASDRRNASRRTLLEQISGAAQTGPGDPDGAPRPSLILHFGARAERVRAENQRFEVAYSAGGKLFRETFDRVISSVGFVPNRPSLNTAKPVFYTGWCVDANGNINTARANAELCAQDIVRRCSTGE